MKLSIAQTDIVWEDKKSNFADAEEYIANAGKKGSDIIVFPEMSMTGFSMDVKTIGEEDESTLNKFKSLSVKENIFIGFGWVEYDGKKGRNNFSITSPEGDEIFRYCKIHPFSFGKEDEFFYKGNEIKFVKIKDMTLSGFICYDLRFPEIFQSASEKSDIIILIANWPEARIEHWDVLLQARAIENQSYIIGVNRVGYGNGIKYNGHSVIYNPLGESILITEEREGLYSTELDCRMVEKVRNNFRVKNDRRKEIYNRFYGKDNYGL